jgi:hypothetical protein
LLLPPFGKDCTGNPTIKVLMSLSIKPVSQLLRFI